MRASIGRFDELVAAEGELVISRRGRPIARVLPMSQNRPFPDHADLRQRMQRFPAVPADASGTSAKTVCADQVPHDAARYRLRRHPPRRCLRNYPIGRVPAPHQAGRTTAALECPEGRDKPDRTPPVSVAEGIRQMVQG